MTFHVGQKVICIDATPVGCLTGGLRKGAIFTIDALIKTTSGTGLSFVEIPVPEGWLAFHPRRFRPIVERKTDISIFTRMLQPRELQSVL